MSLERLQKILDESSYFFDKKSFIDSIEKRLPDLTMANPLKFELPKNLYLEDRYVVGSYDRFKFSFVEISKTNSPYNSVEIEFINTPSGKAKYLRLRDINELIPYLQRHIYDEIAGY